MKKVISVRFKENGKSYYFDPAGADIKTGEYVIVETARGIECGEVVQGVREITDAAVPKALKPITRMADSVDIRRMRQNREDEKRAYHTCQECIARHGLEMKLVEAEYTLDRSKIMFYFTADGRVDFRELVKDLAGVFRTRIELRQIGVRDEARMLGGLGICGRAFCCGCFMDEFAPVSTKMAKTQSMSLNPAKISGACGRLMCCLRYEQGAYEGLVKNVPKNGAFVETPDGYGNVTQVNVLRQTVRVKLDGPGEDTVKGYDADEVAAIPGGRPRDGSQPPHVLVLKPKKPKEPEPEPDRWIMPQMLAEDPADKPAESAGAPKPKRPGSNPRRRKKPAPKGDGAKAAPPKTEGRRPENRPDKKADGKKPERRPDRPAPGEKKPDGARPDSPKADGAKAGPNPRRRSRYRGKPRKDGPAKDGAPRDGGPKEG